MKKRVYRYKDFLKKEEYSKDNKVPPLHSFIREDNSNECFVSIIFRMFELGKKLGKGGKLNKIVINKLSKGFFDVIVEVEKDEKIYKV